MMLLTMCHLQGLPFWALEFGQKENFQLNFESIVFVLILVVELYFFCLAQLLVCGIYINS